MKLRKYQRQGLKAVRKAWMEKKKPLVCVATGGGKTTMIAHLLKSSRRALVIGHTEEIIDQLYTTMKKYFTDVGVVMGNRNAEESRIIVASRQSLSDKRIFSILKYGSFSDIIIDEAHHVHAENSYGKILRVVIRDNPEANVAGFTATPRKNISFFDEIVFTWSVADGIRDGFLVPCSVVVLERCRHWFLASSGAYKKFLLGRQCLAFFSSVKHSIMFANFLNSVGIPSAHVDSNTQKEERSNMIEMFKNGKILTLCNMGVLTEGFDAPNVNALLIVRSMKSNILMKQIFGRGLRTACGKKDCLIVLIT